jgi:hypothetical protein
MKLVILLSSFLAVACWRLGKGSRPAKTAAFGFLLAAVFAAGNYVGSKLETLRYEEQYIFQFSRYSLMLRSFAERQEIEALTNAVIIFDKKFNPHHSAHDLEQVVRDILQNDPAFKSEHPAPANAK